MYKSQQEGEETKETENVLSNVGGHAVARCTLCQGHAVWQVVFSSKVMLVESGVRSFVVVVSKKGKVVDVKGLFRG
jgi:hypothetical protein